MQIDQQDFLKGKTKIVLNQKLNLKTDNKWMFYYFLRLITKMLIFNLILYGIFYKWKTKGLKECI